MNLWKSVGILGVGHMGRALVKGLIESKTVKPTQIYIHDSVERKSKKIAETFGVVGAASPEEVVEKSSAVFVTVKAKDFFKVVEPLRSVFNDQQVAISVAQGVPIDRIKKVLNNCRVARLSFNTPTFVNRGVLGYCIDGQDLGLSAALEDLLKGLGYVVHLDEDEKFEALEVACSSGVGFIYELMDYWQDWLEERGLSPEVAHKVTVQTFMGAAHMAEELYQNSFEDLQNQISSKKDGTEAGLQSMRELEIERIIRYCFEKSSMRITELGKKSDKI